MGDALTVKIEKVDLPRRELLLSVVSNHTAAGDEARFGSSQPAKRAHGGHVAEKGAGRSRKMLRKKSFGNKPKRRKRDR
jgi:hypothetical protein